MKKSFICMVALGLIVAMTAIAAPTLTAVDDQVKKININTATLTELQQLPRIGEKIAQRIIEFRNQNGDFKKIEELLKVKGIGEQMFSRLKDKITVGEGSVK